MATMSIVSRGIEGIHERTVLGLVQEHFAVEVPDPGFEAGWAEAAAEGEAAVGARVDGDPEHLFGVAVTDVRGHAWFGQQGGGGPAGAAAAVVIVLNPEFGRLLMGGRG